MSTISFHSRAGSMIVLSNSNRSARRAHPHREFNNALVVSEKPLHEDDMFEVCIDKKVSSWSGSIEIGVTSTDPAILDFPSSATGLREGSWVMSGMSVFQDGRTLIDEYGEDLDQLSEGDRVGVMRSSSGNLHFFINGINQGVIASIGLTNPVYAVIDLFGKCSQVSIVESRNDFSLFEPATIIDSICFHERCGSMLKLSNENHTAERKRPAAVVNNGVAMTHRPLKDNELFEIRIEELTGPWSRSLDVGVTTLTPETLEFPVTMYNIQSGTTMMNRSGILANGKGIPGQYNSFISDDPKVGDSIGLMRTASGDLHYYCNGVDQGVVASQIPSPVYGVVDLFGLTIKVAISSYVTDTSSSPPRKPTSLAIALSPCHTFSASYNDEDLLFHPRCGDHVAVVNGGRTAIRPNCQDDFNNAVVLTERPLRPGEFFQVVLEHIVAKWAGSIEIGVTTHCAQDFAFPPTMTNVRSGTWMMTGNGILCNGTTVIDEYGHNLDKLKAGDRVGLIVTAERKLHFYVNGGDEGLAASNIPENVYGVIDLYGQAAKASIVYSPGTTPLNEDPQNVPSTSYHRIYRRNRNLGAIPRTLCLGKREVNHLNESSKSVPLTLEEDILRYFPDGEDNDMRAAKNPLPPREPPLTFHPVYGAHVLLNDEGSRASRISDCNHGLVFSEKPFELEGFFEVEVFISAPLYAGVLRMGLTTYVPKDQDRLPATAFQLENCDSWILFDGHLYENGRLYRKNYCPMYFHLRAGDKVGVKKDDDGNLSYVINDKELEVVAQHLPRNLYVVCDMYGSTECIKLLKASFPPAPEICDKTFLAEMENNSEPLAFHKNHGENIELTQENKIARRIKSYCHGIVLTNRSLLPGEMFEVRIDSLNLKWSSTVRIGVTKLKPDELNLPMTFFNVQKYTWVFCEDCLYHNGEKILKNYGSNLDDIDLKQKIGVMVNDLGELTLFVDDVSYGTAIGGISFPCYGLVDVYGECVQVSFPDIVIEENEVDSDKENQEKADTEGIKESVGKLVLSRKPPSIRCKFRNSCNRARVLFGLYDAFFVLDEIDCFCDICHKRRGNITCTKGEIPKVDSQPVGWCRFELEVFSKADKSMLENWNTAYYGVKPGDVRRILDYGKLLPPDQLGLKIFDPRASESEREASSRVLVSPLLKHAALPKFSPLINIIDRENNAKIQFNLAFQVFIQPGSYTVNLQTAEIKEPIDSQLNEIDLEWYTKEKGSTLLYGLLVRIENYEVQPS